MKSVQLTYSAPIHVDDIYSNMSPVIYTFSNIIVPSPLSEIYG